MMFNEEELKVVKDRKRFPWDLTSAEGKRRFEDYVNNVNAKTPGVVAPEGQQFDFKKYYAEIGVWFFVLSMKFWTLLIWDDFVCLIDGIK